jgi:hypothetical protein
MIVKHVYQTHFVCARKEKEVCCIKMLPQGRSNLHMISDEDISYSIYFGNYRTGNIFLTGLNQQTIIITIISNYLVAK